MEFCIAVAPDIFTLSLKITRIRPDFFASNLSLKSQKITMKKSTNLKLEKQTIAIIKNNAGKKLANTETGAGGILASLVEICTSLTK